MPNPDWATERKVVHSFSELRRPLSKSRLEWRYKCPFCLELRGKEDTDGALYFNVQKRVGACWKCKVVIVDDYNTDIESLHALYYARVEAAGPAEYNLDGWTRPAGEVPWAAEYLRKRGFGPDVLERYHVLAAESPERCVVLPNRVLPNGRTDFFQIRYIDADRIKYTNPTGADKPVYGTHTVGDRGRAFVCEGCFSSMAMAQVSDEWGSLATYGKAISDSQQRILGPLPVREYCVVYDGGEVDATIRTAKQVLGFRDSASAVLLPYDEDPNSIDAGRLRECVRHYTLPVTQLTLALVDQYRRSRKIRNRDRAGWDDLRGFVRSKFAGD